MWARFFIVLSLVTLSPLLRSGHCAEVLPNAIRIDEIPSTGDRFELIVGYQAGVRSETRGLSGLSSIIGHYLASTAAARSIALAAYGAGGEIEFLNDLDRNALRVTAPMWARPMILDQVAAFLDEIPSKNSELVGRAVGVVLGSASERSVQFKARIEDEIRVALLGSHPYQHTGDGWKSDLEQITVEDVNQFFADNCGTDRAFVLTTAPFPDDLRQKLSAVKSRSSRKLRESTVRVARAERSLRFTPEDSPGAVIFASPVPGVFYQSWYSVLLLDRLVRRVVPGKPQTALVPTLDPYYWRVEVPVPIGQFAESIEETLMQEINRLQFSRARPDDLEAARREAVEYLESPYVLAWFRSHGLEARRTEGLQWVRNFTADDVRSTARDVILVNRVLASWSPRPAQKTVEVTSLRDASATAQSAPAGAKYQPLGAVPVSPFPPHTDPPNTVGTPERLSSGVWLAASTVPALFLSGLESAGLPEGTRREGPNGVWWRVAAEMDANAMRAFQKYRADRILVLVPPGSLNRARTLWNSFRGNNQDRTQVNPVGKVANIDMPALMVLKVILDRKLIEAGSWGDAAVRIDATRGANLEIEGPSEIRTQIIEWIKAVAAGSLPEADFLWAREAVMHHLNDVLPDVQTLLWQRVPDYVLPGIETMAPSHVQDVAKLYF